VGRLCTPRVAKIVILIVTLVGLIVCHFPFWIIEVKNGRCDPKPHFMKIYLSKSHLCLWRRDAELKDSYIPSDVHAGCLHKTLVTKT
ncbi:hypothetical protein Bpfe_003958, partial [Biomphalaria pfeifferi]